jgi:sulfur-oxidizing protein SoxB
MMIPPPLRAGRHGDNGALRASGFGNWSRLAAQQVLSQDDLIGSSDFGNVSLIHITDIHAQTQPIYFREPEFNIGVGGRRAAAASGG